MFPKQISGTPEMESRCEMDSTKTTQLSTAMAALAICASDAAGAVKLFSDAVTDSSPRKNFHLTDTGNWRGVPWKFKAGRNDPCPCGSGVKFKRCCYGKAGDS